jgi:hypothetical protein
MLPVRLMAWVLCFSIARLSSRINTDVRSRVCVSWKSPLPQEWRVGQGRENTGILKPCWHSILSLSLSLSLPLALSHCPFFLVTVDT